MKRKNGVESVKGLFAFWRHDIFPYVLGDEIDAIDEHGNVRGTRYQGRWFRPIKIMSTRAGRALQERLTSMQAERTAAIVKIEQAANAELFDHALPEARDPDVSYPGFPRKVDERLP